MIFIILLLMFYAFIVGVTYERRRQNVNEKTTTRLEIFGYAVFSPFKRIYDFFVDNFIK